ncbi:MAG TPA: hypothetical protein ENJ27_01715 [Candidatus Moranbacteria bacterium]|nr:hypothetical protein [Candidatus Moranbacteria bacterium]
MSFLRIFRENSTTKESGINKSNSREQNSDKAIDNLVNRLILEYLTDHTLFLKEAEEKITTGLKNLAEEKNSETFKKIKQVEQLIILFSSHKIRLVNNLNNPKEATEIIEKLNTLLVDLTALLNIGFDNPTKSVSKNNTSNENA